MARSYTEQDKQRGLMALVLNSGSERKASKMCGIPRATLRDWARKHPDELDTLRRQELPKIYARVAAEYEGLIRKGIDVQNQILDRLREEVPNLAPKELPGAWKNTSISTAIATDKMSHLRGEPSTIVVHEHRSLKDVDEDLTRLLKRVGWIDGEAQEINPAQLEKVAEVPPEKREASDDG
jgi:hypothetical protein